MVFHVPHSYLVEIAQHEHKLFWWWPDFNNIDSHCGSFHFLHILIIGWPGTCVWKGCFFNSSILLSHIRNSLPISFWCAILIAHQLLWQNMEAPVSIFQESPLAGGPSKRLFHIHSIHHYQLCAKYLYRSALLWQMNGCNPSQQPGVIHWCYLFHCCKFNDV